MPQEATHVSRRILGIQRRCDMWCGGRTLGERTARPSDAVRQLSVGRQTGGSTSCWAGSWSCGTIPIGHVSPFGPWLQYPSGFLCRYCWWQFPAGEVEPGETEQSAAVRVTAERSDSPCARCSSEVSGHTWLDKRHRRLCEHAQMALTLEADGRALRAVPARPRPTRRVTAPSGVLAATWKSRLPPAEGGVDGDASSPLPGRPSQRCSTDSATAHQLPVASRARLPSVGRSHSPMFAGALPVGSLRSGSGWNPLRARLQACEH